MLRREARADVQPAIAASPAACGQTAGDACVWSIRASSRFRPGATGQPCVQTSAATGTGIVPALVGHGSAQAGMSISRSSQRAMLG